MQTMNHIKDIEQRETIEWSNTWWEKANDVKQKRIALLGDSVTRGFRSKLNNRLEGRYVVDICASSSQITDLLLWKQYKFFFECSELKYSQVFLHAGGHHGHDIQRCLDEEYSDFFRMSYKKILDLVCENCSDIAVLSYTPSVKKGNLSEWDTLRNKELEARNKIVYDIAKEYGIPYIDIWNPFLTGNFVYRDFIHFGDDGNEFIAEQCLSHINMKEKKE